MGLVQRPTASGLIVAEQSADEAGLSRALKQIDDRLVLQRAGMYYQVLCVTGWDRPDQVTTILTWMDAAGNPLPLSSGVLDAVQALHVGARSQGPDADERNEQFLASVRRDRDSAEDTILGEHRARLERSQTQVSMATSIRRNRSKRPGRSGLR